MRYLLLIAIVIFLGACSATQQFQKSKLNHGFTGNYGEKPAKVFAKDYDVIDYEKAWFYLIDDKLYGDFYYESQQRCFDEAQKMVNWFYQGSKRNIYVACLSNCTPTGEQDPRYRPSKSGVSCTQEPWRYLKPAK